jgi:Rieske Fe-S protein
MNILKTGDDCPLGCGGNIYLDGNFGEVWFCDCCANTFDPDGTPIALAVDAEEEFE